MSRTSPAEFSYPMRCLRCYGIHDAATVTPVSRYSDCTTWRCPDCKSLIDDRPRSWGGSAVAVSEAESIWSDRIATHGF